MLPHVEEDGDVSVVILSIQREGTFTPLTFLARPLEFDNIAELPIIGFVTNALAGLTIMVAMQRKSENLARVENSMYSGDEIDNNFAC